MASTTAILRRATIVALLVLVVGAYVFGSRLMAPRKERLALISRAQYEAFSLALHRERISEKTSLEEIERLYRKHGLTREQVEAAVGEYGKAKSVIEEQRRTLDAIRQGDITDHVRDEIRRQQQLTPPIKQ